MTNLSSFNYINEILCDIDKSFTTVNSLQQHIKNNCLTIRHIDLTSEFLLKLHEYLEDKSTIKNDTKYNDNTSINDIGLESFDDWNDLELRTSIPTKYCPYNISNNIETPKQSSVSLDTSDVAKFEQSDIWTIQSLEFWNCSIEYDDYDYEYITSEILSDVIMVISEITKLKFISLKFAFNFMDDTSFNNVSKSFVYLYD
eukprot:CAMPEP_0114663362 /NCGR_PEP_ID=MMETSP0191-20121206/26756_1 /TAXON_ID=126664 /ORGANISM="Sorites sp." /LENGTH=199 /DNA_ID=CAMNT_0001902477 /DNA_START=18 /DNA_END=614 /DNA_ORIENTATION=-